jgi:hypothetical protein
MNEKEKLNLILEYKNIVRKFIELTTNISNEVLDFRPQSDFWTIREHIAHVFDSEIFGFTRLRKSIAEPDTGVEAFNQDMWQLSLDYSEMNIIKSINVIELLNDITSNHLLTIIDSDWTSYFINHPERGKDNLEMLVKRRISHLKDHIDYINRNNSLYKNS